MLTAQNVLQESFKVSDYGMFLAFLSRTSIVDYGVVMAVNGNLVDVRNVTYPGTEETVTRDVELLFPSSSGLSIQYEIAEGDTVLLIGSRRYVKSLADYTTPKQEINSSGYDKACLKAIPISFISGDAKFNIIEKDGKLKMSNQTQSLYSLITDLLTEIKSILSNIESIQTVGSPANHALSPTSINKFVTNSLNIDTIGQNIGKLLY